MILFREILIEDAEKLLNWRLMPEVSKWMLSSVENDINTQRSWILNMRKNKYSYHWIIQINKNDIGYVKIDNINLCNLSVETGFYIGEFKYSYMTIGILHTLYSTIFNIYKFNLINVSVIEGNNIINIHKMSGYIPDADRKISKLERNNSLIIPYKLEKNTFITKYKNAKPTELPAIFWEANPFIN